MLIFCRDPRLENRCRSLIISVSSSILKECKRGEGGEGRLAFMGIVQVSLFGVDTVLNKTIGFRVRFRGGDCVWLGLME